jgi:MFS family permease
MVITSLVPPHAHKKFKKLTAFEVSLMVSGWQISFAICSPIIGNYLGSFGRKNALILAVAVECAVSICFCLFYQVDDVRWYWWLNFVTRMVEGAAEATAMTAVSAIIAIEFKD